MELGLEFFDKLIVVFCRETISISVIFEVSEKIIVLLNDTAPLNIEDTLVKFGVVKLMG